MRKNSGKAYMSEVAWKMLKSSNNYNVSAWNILIKVETLLHLPERVINKIRKFIKGKN